ncbi:GDNF-inducible zinc finger protein 1-like [Toxorhynchites rutilus septentrionalis]|uniref:GDNF-inducible zinc finger protein 1-like n=1 Tax=Toxorhynchites rutilus septentrionalis TaxID=329112 RepID=UPI0024790F7B|nr:GDNF-inducible zinc finger protein 1-like [Toxorhynchites rutilus septentrionalis]
MKEACCKCNLPKETTNPPAGSGSASFRYICRLCLMRAEDTEPIFIHPGDNTMAYKIFACTGVQVDENAAIGPTSICVSCKTSIYRSYQFLEMCQRNNKIIQNLLNNHEKSLPEHEPIRLVIRTVPGQTDPSPANKRKRANSRRKSTRSMMEASTSESDISWSDFDEQCDEDADENIPVRQAAYETDTQESPQNRGPSIGESKVPSLIIPLARLNKDSSIRNSNGRISRTSTVGSIDDSNLFQCGFCDVSFPYRIQIRQHIDLYHSEQKHELECKFCTKTFLTAEELSEHYRHKHAKPETYECKRCQRFFTSFNGLQQHYKSLMHRAACGEAVYPRRRTSCHSFTSPARTPSINSDYGSDYPSSGSRPRRKSTQSRSFIEDEFDPFEYVCYDEIPTYKCDYCDACFDDKQSLAKHTDVRPCRVELEPLNLDLLLEKIDLDELLRPLNNNSSDVIVVEPTIEIVDLT